MVPTKARTCTNICNTLGSIWLSVKNLQQYVFLLDPSNHMGKNLTVYGMNLRLILTNTIKNSEKYLYFIFPSEELRDSDVTIFFGKNHHKSFICQKAIKQYRWVEALSSHYDAPWWHTDGCRTSAIHCKPPKRGVQYRSLFACQN